MASTLTERPCHYALISKFEDFILAVKAGDMSRYEDMGKGLPSPRFSGVTLTAYVNGEPLEAQSATFFHKGRVWK